MDAMKSCTGIVMQKYRRIACIVLILCMFSLVIVFCKKSSVGKDNRIKYILQWTSPDTDPFYLMGIGQEQFLKRNCPVNNCHVTPHTSLLNSVKDFDAILFHAPEFCQKSVSFPTERSLHQKYVLVSRESPVYYPLTLPRYDGMFNWTYTFKLNSDVYFGYVIIKNKEGNVIGPRTNMHWLESKDMKAVDSELKSKLKSKKLAAAWFVSNCDSKSRRETFALELRKELAENNLVLDIYSEFCPWNETKSCPKPLNMNVAGKDCLRRIETDYYFYLSFENSFSEDYVTEKLLNAVQNYAVPIVYGGANYTRFLPDGAYLDANKLGLKKLVEKIVNSIENKEVYYDFFKWTNHYSYHSIDETPETDYMCALCNAINNVDLVKQTSTYENMRKWWTP